MALTMLNGMEYHCGFDGQSMNGLGLHITLSNGLIVPGWEIETITVQEDRG